MAARGGVSYELNKEIGPAGVGLSQVLKEQGGPMGVFTIGSPCPGPTIAEVEQTMARASLGKEFDHQE